MIDEDRKPLRRRYEQHRAIKKLWREYGGRQHGPRVETMTIPEERFFDFLDAVSGLIALPAAREALAAVMPPVTDAEVEDVCRRLEAGYEKPGFTYDTFGTWVPNNPDGSEAAALIRALHARATTARDLLREAGEALRTAESYGCPVCGGDCHSANPPVALCPMQQYRAALAAYEAQKEGRGS